MANGGPKIYNDRQRIVFWRGKIGVISYRKRVRIVSDWAIDLGIYYAIIPNVIIKIELRKYPKEPRPPWPCNHDTLCDYNIQNNNLENPGIDPGTSRMRSGRSTIWANSPPAQRRSIRKVHIKALTKTQLLFQPRPEKKHQGTTKYKTQLVNPKLSLFKWKEERKNNGENFEQIRKDDNWLNPTQLQEVNYGWINWMSKTYLPIPFAKKIKAPYVIFPTSKHC